MNLSNRYEVSIGPGAYLRVILHGEYRTADVLEALNGAVVQVDIAHAGDLRVNRLAYNGIAVGSAR